MNRALIVELVTVRSRPVRRISGRAFTLIELLVVVSIIALLLSVLQPPGLTQRLIIMKLPHRPATRQQHQRAKRQRNLALPAQKHIRSTGLTRAEGTLRVVDHATSYNRNADR